VLVHRLVREKRFGIKPAYNGRGRVGLTGLASVERFSMAPVFRFPAPQWGLEHDAPGVKAV
jgi:hypothetical protein